MGSYLRAGTDQRGADKASLFILSINFTDPEGCFAYLNIEAIE